MGATLDDLIILIAKIHLIARQLALFVPSQENR